VAKAIIKVKPDFLKNAKQGDRKDDQDERSFAVLEISPVKSALDAVRAPIMGVDLQFRGLGGHATAR
jgi:hypothetical protein